MEYRMDRIRCKNPIKLRPTERQLNWQNLELTAFFHFTVNTFTGREWGSGSESPEIFQPLELDCRQWLKTIKDAGFKLAILTAKHHDGFCLWPTKYTDHSVKSSSWRDGNGDVLREFVEACKEYDILPGVYLSPWDRNHSSYGSSAYNDFFVDQLKEVLTDYGPFYEVWFDGACAEGSNGKKQVYDWNRYYETIREIAPQANIAITGPDVRWVGNEHGYGHKTEWNIVEEGAFDQHSIEKQFEEFHYEDRQGLNKKPKKYPSKVVTPMIDGKDWIWYPSEVDVSIRPGWFYHKYQDKLVKSHNRLVNIYYRSVGYGSGLLLNFPPDMRGLIHEVDVMRMKEVKETLDKTFKTQLAGSGVSDIKKEKNGKVLLAEFSEKVTLDRIVLKENIAEGQLIAEFILEYMNSLGRWKRLAEGTTIGYKRIIRSKKVSTKAVRMRVIASLSDINPDVISMKFFKSSKRDRTLFF
jgi:alpha-L-fucosidase